MSNDNEAGALAMTPSAIRTVRGVATIILAIAVAGIGHPAAAQRIVPAGVHAHSTPVAFTPQLVAPTPILIGRSSDTTRGHPWQWIGIGAVVGGASAGIAGAVTESHSDDAFFAGPAIAIVAIAGALVGGLLGGVAYLVTHL
jgi:hypothetical protein